MSDQTTIPEATKVLEADGATCATLTPLIQATIRQLDSGSVLAVRTDDPSAQEGVPAWSRLSGNELMATVEEADGHTRFYLRKQ